MSSIPKRGFTIIFNKKHLTEDNLSKKERVLINVHFPEEKKSGSKGEKYNDTAHALENMRRSPYTVTRAPRGPATQGEASEADLSGNQPIATHEASLKLTANAEPEHPRQSLWRESVRAFLRCLRARLLRSRGSKTMKKAPSRPCLHPLLLKKRPFFKKHVTSVCLDPITWTIHTGYCTT